MDGRESVSFMTKEEEVVATAAGIGESCTRHSKGWLSFIRPGPGKPPGVTQ